jgi:hypothetical protein
MKLLMVFLAAGLLCASVAQGATLGVPSPYATIGSALAVASSGDTVLVGPGVYYENLTMTGGVVLVSEVGAAGTIIDGSGSDIVVRCMGLGSDTEIVGFTIRNGYASGSSPGGGGILISGGEPRIAENIIFANVSAYDGGGVFCLSCSSIIEDNEFRQNSSNVAAGLDGGGLFIYGNCDGIVRRNVFRENSAQEGGGMGITPAGATVTVSENLFWGNYAYYWGGGIALGVGAAPTIDKNTFYANQASGGGAISFGTDSSPIISKNIVAGHTASAIYCTWEHGTVAMFCNDMWNIGPNYEGGTYDTTSNLSEDPLLCNPSLGDFHLQAGSPCDDHPFCSRIGAYGTGCLPYFPPDHPEILTVSHSQLIPAQESIITFCIVDSTGARVWDEGTPASVSTAFGLGNLSSVLGLPDTTYQFSYTAAFAPGTDSIYVYDSDCEEEQYACTTVEITGPAPDIVSVTDVPEDEGGTVTVRWTRSPLDALPDTLITHYSVWRSLPEVTGGDPENLFLVSAADVGPDFAGPGYRMATTGTSLFYWEWMDNVPAHYFEGYSYTAQTLMDSTGSNPGWHYFLVSAHTADDFVFYDSEPDSGYSVDNLAPDPPGGLAGDYAYPPPEVLITWRPNEETDLSHYSVYRGESQDFIPGEANRIGAPEDTFFVDAAFDPNIETYYKVSAVDIHENESAHSMLGPDQITDAPGSPSVPDFSRLDQNVPNPFNPVTAIRFATARPGPVTLAVFDVSGRPVRTLVEGWKQAQRHEATWDGRDERGNPVASGVYLYRLEAPGLTDTKKMILLR